MPNHSPPTGGVAPPQPNDVSPDEPSGESLQQAILTYLAPDDDTRKRAQWEAWEFDVVASHEIRVVNASWGTEKDAHAYTVGVTDRGRLFVPAECDCRADLFHDGPCKHRVAVALHGGPELLGRAVVYHEPPDRGSPGVTTLADRLGY